MESKLVFKGENQWDTFSGFYTILVLIVTGVGFVWVFNLASIICGTCLIVVGFFLISLMIKKITFKEHEIEVLYFFGKKKNIAYGQLSRIYKNMLGISENYLYVLEYTVHNDKDQTKFYHRLPFYCQKNNIHHVFSHLKSVGVPEKVINDELTDSNSNNEKREAYHDLKLYIESLNLIEASEIKLTTTIENDLGLTGDDAVAFIEEFAYRYQVNIESFNYDNYFRPEGVYVTHKIRYDVTMQQLLDGMINKKLE